MGSKRVKLNTLFYNYRLEQGIKGDSIHPPEYHDKGVVNLLFNFFSGRAGRTSGDGISFLYQVNG